MDAGKQAGLAQRAGATWDRVLFLWQEIQPDSANDWYLDRYIDRFGLRASLESGLPIIAVIQGTPQWAAENRSHGVGAVPRGLNYPYDDERNTFGRFMLRLANEFAERFDGWVIWNEPDFQPGDSGDWNTWRGTTADMLRLVRSGYHAIKRVDRTATVVFPATTYFVDAVNGRELYFKRVLAEAVQDPDATRYGFYFDAVAINLYCSLDAIPRVAGLYREIMRQYALDKPLWLTETNCPVYDDATAPITPAYHVTTTDQAAYLLQSMALARAAGYQRIGWYGMVDHDDRTGITDRYGLLRADGSPRPAFRAFETATRYLGAAGPQVTAAPLGEQRPDGSWPVWRVVFDNLSTRTRLQVLWRGVDGPRTVRLAVGSTDATLVDVLGFSTTPRRNGDTWEIDLPAVRVPQPFDPPGFLSTGAPVLLVERDLPPVRTLDVPRASS